MSDRQMIVRIRYASGAVFTYTLPACEVDAYVREAEAVGAQVSVATELPVRRNPLHSSPQGAA